MKYFQRLLIYFFFGFICSTELFPTNVLIGIFSPHNSDKNLEIESQILESLKKELSEKNFSVTFTKEKKENVFKSVNNSNPDFYLEGQYTKEKNSPLSVYIQVYNPNSGKIIDAMSESINLKSFQGIELDQSELNKSNEEIIKEFAKQVAIDLALNPDRKESRENIQDHLISKPIYSQGQFPISQQDTKQEARNTFKLIEDQSIITASRSKESILDVPATTMVITEADFKNRGYTSLDDIFRDLPGMDYIKNYGTDDAVIYMRGYRTPFTSRILFMINGIVENDLWVQVATPNRQYPISNIKRIEIIYGPASAVYGPNAFQGIINIITKDGRENKGKSLSGKTSAMYGSGPMWAVDGGVTSQIGDLSLAMSARKQEGNDANKNISNYGYNSKYWLENPLVWGPLLYYGDGGRPFGKYSDPVNDWGTILSASYKTLKVGANITNKYEGYGAQYPGDKSQPTTMWGKTGKNFYFENQAEITGRLTSYTLAVYRESRIYGNWAEANGTKSFNSNISFTRWNEESKSMLFNQNLEYKLNNNIKIITGIKGEFKKLTKAYDIPGYWWGQSYFSSVDFLNPNINTGIEKFFPNGYSIGNSNDPLILKGPSPKNKMPDENTIGTYDRGGFILTTIDWGKFRFSPGVRYDVNSIYGSSTNPRITGIYRINNSNAFKLLYGEAFNEPSPLNLFAGFSGRTADLKLKPEKAKTTEAIYMLQGNRSLNEFSVYYSRYENVIKESAQNAGRRRIYGIEYKFRWDMQNYIFENSAPISIYLYYTYTRALADTYYDHNLSQWQMGVTPLGHYEYLFPDQAKLIPRKREYSNLGDIAPHKLNFGINLPIKKLFIFNLRGNYIGTREFYSRNYLSNQSPLSNNDPELILRRIVAEQDKRIDPYFIFDTGITIHFKEDGYLTFKVLNLFNSTYFHPGTQNGNAGNYYYGRSQGFDSSIIPQPNRTFIVNLTLTF